MWSFPVIILLVAFAIDAKRSNYTTLNIDPLLDVVESLSDLELNQMIDQDGILNQDGSILQMALKQNGE